MEHRSNLNEGQENFQASSKLSSAMNKVDVGQSWSLLRPVECKLRDTEKRNKLTATICGLNQVANRANTNYKPNYKHTKDQVCHSKVFTSSSSSSSSSIMEAMREKTESSSSKRKRTTTATITNGSKRVELGAANLRGSIISHCATDILNQDENDDRPALATCIRPTANSEEAAKILNNHRHFTDQTIDEADCRVINTSLIGVRRQTVVNRMTRSVYKKTLLTSNTNNILMLLALGLLLSLFSLLGPISSPLANAIRLQPEGKEKFYWSGETFVITCQNSNNIKNVKIRWLGPNNQLISENRSKRIHAESSGPHGTRLVVLNATLQEDEGTYKCTIGSPDDQRPRETIEFSLKLLKATNFKDTQNKLALTTGKMAEIDCRVEFDPNVSPGTVSWYKNGQPVDTNSDSSIQVIEYQPDKQLSQLILSPVRREHEGIYTCQATSVTPQLSKLNNFDIQLDINYAPIFDTLEQTIWVESSQAIASRLGSTSNGPNQSLAASNRHEQHNNVFKASPKHQSRLRQPNRLSHIEAQETNEHNGNNQNLNGDDRTVRVELRCVCQANPAANIMWFTNSNHKIAVAKGNPQHVIEEPKVEVVGHNTTSVLVVAYNLDSNWQFKNDEYKCNAVNVLGNAIKKYTIEQGNPPPAFNVGPYKSYNAETAMFEFTLLGPNFDPQNLQQAHHSQQQQQKDMIVPPVDAFRIRAEFGTIQTTASQAELQTTSSRHADIARRQFEPSVQFSYPPVEKGQQRGIYKQQTQPWRAQNFNISLSKLPTGMQRLYLEAHNAVGWSPNATHLGDFYLVSGALSNSILSGASMCHQLTIFIICQAAILFVTITLRNS